MGFQTDLINKAFKQYENAFGNKHNANFIETNTEIVVNLQNKKSIKNVRNLNNRSHLLQSLNKKLNVNEKYEIEFILLPEDERDESKIYKIKINKNIIKNNDIDWISLNGFIYEYLIKIDPDYKNNLNDEKYRVDMIKSGLHILKTQF